MKLVLICDGPQIPSGRFRAFQLVPGLRARGWQCEVHTAYGDLYNSTLQTPLAPVYKAVCRARRALQTARPHGRDVVILSQKISVPTFAWPEELAARRAPFVFDFDDALFLEPDGRPSAARARAFERIARAASHVIAGNAFLAARVPSGVPTTVIPTVIDLLSFTPREVPDPDGPVFGWIGTASNFPSLRQALPWILRGLDRVQGSKLRIVSNGELPELVGNVRVEMLTWSSEREADQVASFDVGLMPLEDTAATQGKCGFKLIEYMAMGKPVIASAVGANVDIVGASGAGLLVDRLEDWPDAMASLGRDPAARRAAGVAGRAHVERRYSLDAAIDRYDAIFRDVARSA